jgi:pimeloyl-ACP methyl ester carboxylesterase
VTSASRGLIFLNTGGDPRSSAGRFAVQASRSLAAAGHVCLRFDFSGQGDSPEPEGVQRSHAYETPRLDEIEAALRRVAAEGVTDISLFGVSAGAFHAFHTALIHPALKGAFCVSQVEYIWQPGAKVSVSGNGWRLSTRHYLTGALRASNWRRVLTGEAPLSRVTKDLVMNFAAWCASGSVRREKRNLLRGLARASSRGVRIHCVVGTRDPALGALETLFGLGGRLLTRSKNMTVLINEDIDHGLVYKSSRNIAFRELCDWLGVTDARL